LWGKPSCHDHGRDVLKNPLTPHATDLDGPFSNLAYTQALDTPKHRYDGARPNKFGIAIADDDPRWLVLVLAGDVQCF